MRCFREIKRGSYVTKNTILTKQIMLGAIGWRYGGKCFFPLDFSIPKNKRNYCFVATNENGELVEIGKTMQEAEAFCLQKYIEFYETHPEERDWLPNPYERKKVKSEIIIVKTRRIKL